MLNINTYHIVEHFALFEYYNTLIILINGWRLSDDLQIVREVLKFNKSSLRVVHSTLVIFLMTNHPVIPSKQALTTLNPKPTAGGWWLSGDSKL